MSAWDLKPQTYCNIYNCTGLRNRKDVWIGRPLAWMELCLPPARYKLL